ncbi:MAG: DNA replication/repair protein RecF [Lactobacillaceae bacterium]|jgi:DNA replication and repair protein RecF|nr:DNA replication/repair protein RecF [Lactobacillaceae bacterium]
MLVKDIKLKNFRNYQDLNLEFSSKINVFVGNNAQGKTNILEALYLSSLTNSHRTSNYKEMIEWGKSESAVSINVKKEIGNIKLDIQLGKNGKKARINNLTSNKLSEYIGKLNVVLFAPEDLELVKGSPSIRRKFMDLEFVQMSSEYLFNLLNFKTVLKNRNTYLKKPIESQDQDYLEVLNFQLIEYGSQLIKKRFELIEKLSLIAQEIHQSIANDEKLEIKYKTFKKINSKTEIDEIKEIFLIELNKNRKREDMFQTTLVGPHHDDIVFFINDKEVATFASQGQQRTTALSTRLAEIKLIKEQTGEYPILLLDDVFSELDSNRQTHLIKYIEDKVQTFITTPSLSDINQEIIKEPKIFYVDNGEVENG